MQPSLHHPSATDRRAIRQHECNMDEARWEAQLRKLARRKPIEEKRPPPARPSLVQSPLELTARVTSRDVLLIPRHLPAFTGDEHQDLTCGRCSSVIGSGIALRTARREHPEGDRLVVRCLCGALNLLSLQSGRSAIRSRH